VDSRQPRGCRVIDEVRERIILVFWTKGPLRRATQLLRPLVADRRFAAIVLGVAIAVVAVPTALEAWLSHASVFGLTWFEGFFEGFLVATFLALVGYLALIYTGARSHVVGALGEQWTAEELDKLGPEWRQFRNLPFDEGHGDSSYEVDIDHVAVGPFGVVVIETKFSTAEVDLTTEAPSELVDDAIRQASRNAGRIRALLERDASFATVVPALVFWGPRVIEPGAVIRRYGDVRAFAGRQSDQWLPKFQITRSLSDEEIAIVAGKIRDYEGSRQSDR
jgi:Nuclease-related domain